MAGRAVINDSCVIECGIEKAAGNMTDTAILSGGHMVGALARGGNPIVARGTVVHNAGMVKHRGDKRGGVMTVGAI